MLCLGVDPDLHDLSIGAWGDQGPITAFVVHVPTEKGRVENEAALAMMRALTAAWPGLAEPKASAVEAQELRRAGVRRHARPQDIVTLAQVAGMAVMRLAATFPRSPIYFPKPSQWKGEIPKAVMQARLYSELGWGYVTPPSADYSRPERPPASFSPVSKGQWKHVGDALLLARWCWEQEAGYKWLRS